MTESHIRDDLLDYLDRPHDLPQSLREHLVSDAPDRQWWQRTLDMHDALGLLGACEPPADAVTATLRSAQAAAARTDDRRKILAFPPWGRAIALGMTAAVVLVMVGLPWLQRPAPPDAPPTAHVRRVVYYDYGLPETPAPVAEHWGEFEIEPSGDSKPRLFRIMVPATPPGLEVGDDAESENW